MFFYGYSNISYKIYLSLIINFVGNRKQGWLLKLERLSRFGTMQHVILTLMEAFY